MSPRYPPLKITGDRSTCSYYKVEEKKETENKKRVWLGTSLPRHKLISTYSIYWEPRAFVTLDRERIDNGKKIIKTGA